MNGTGDFFWLPSGGVRLAEELRFSGRRPRCRWTMVQILTLGTADGASNSLDRPIPVTKTLILHSPKSICITFQSCMFVCLLVQAAYRRSL
jgi:hypothetical protein